jgi:hypothetical protein
MKFSNRSLHCALTNSSNGQNMLSPFLQKTQKSCQQILPLSWALGFLNMDSIVNNKMKKCTFIFSSIYLIIWLTSSLIINSFDYVHGLIIGAEIVDSWSLGIMFWFCLVLIVPAIYVLIMIYLVINKAKNGAV